MKNWLEQIWWRSEPPPRLLQGLAFLYGKFADGLAARRRRQAIKLAVPVIVVGNIAVGGTGKTPITLSLLELLRSMGHHPGVISRGYGGSGPFPMLVDAHSAAARAGDEPLLIARRSGAPACVAAKRVLAGKTLLAAHPEVDVLICDDGLQHLALARDLEICVVDGARGHGNGWRIPAGPLREPPQRLASCNWVLVNGGEAQPYGGKALRFDLQQGAAVNLVSGEQRALSEFAGSRVHAVAGIGNPARFFFTLRGHGLQVTEHPFADHQIYTAALLAFGDDAAVLMTEKDAVKCTGFNDLRLWALPVTARFAAADEERLRLSLTQLFTK